MIRYGACIIAIATWALAVPAQAEGGGGGGSDINPNYDLLHPPAGRRTGIAPVPTDRTFFTWNPFAAPSRAGPGATGTPGAFQAPPDPAWNIRVTGPRPTPSALRIRRELGPSGGSARRPTAVQRRARPPARTALQRRRGTVTITGRARAGALRAARRGAATRR